MVKKQMTLEEFDMLCDRIRNNPYQCSEWWPSMEDLNSFVIPNPEAYIEFLIWLLETADEPKTEEEKASRKAINQIMTKTLEIT